MNTRFKDVFRGKVVNKRLTVNTGVDEFPRFVVEYLLDNYCTEENFQDDLQQVIKRLRENFVHGAEAEKIRHQIRETRNHNIIASLEVRLQETEDKYWGTIGAINESFVNVTESLVRQYPMLLSGGMWGTINLTYDETEVHNKKIRPFKVTEFTPFQISVIDLNEYIEKRKQFEAGEWLDFLINSIGLNPEPMTRREKLLYLWRLVPMIEANCNTIELAPRETGKTYIYRNQSYYVTVLSGGKATPASLFINNATGKVGVVGSRDAVVFDEIANTDFTDPKALVSIMQGYMQDAKFSRGKKEILAFASIVLVGNIDIQAKLPHEKYYHLFEPLPDFLQVEAFIDRLHGYLPGWEIPKIHPGSLAQDYGFITDYFCEIMHELRRKDVLGALKNRYELIDTSTAKAGITGRDVRGVEKVLSGLLKLMYPHGKVNDEQLGELLEVALEGRQRVRNQLHLMAAGEYGPVVLTGKLIQSGRVITPTLPDAHREQKVALPSSPRIGEVIGLAVIGDDRGCLLHFEMQATKGSGRIVSLGSMQKVMKESVAAANQFIKTHAKDVGLPNDWQDNHDIAVLATMMGVEWTGFQRPTTKDSAWSRTPWAGRSHHSYGNSKMADCEIVLRYFALKDLPHSILRVAPAPTVNYTVREEKSNRFVEVEPHPEDEIRPLGYNVSTLMLGCLHAFLKRWMMKKIAREAGKDMDTSKNHEYTDWNAVDQFVSEFSSCLEQHRMIEAV